MEVTRKPLATKKKNRPISKGSGPRHLRLDALRQRVKREGIQEVILALSTDVEGDATASFIEDALRPSGIRVTRLAFGLPAGSGIRYSDAVTLARAMRGRTGERGSHGQ